MAQASAFSTTAPSGSDMHWIVAGSVAPVLILSSSSDQRSHASIFNDANASLYLRFGGGGVGVLSPTGSYDVKVLSGTLFPLPKPIYQGEVWGIWDAATGRALVLSLGIDS